MSVRHSHQISRNISGQISLYNFSYREAGNGYFTFYRVLKVARTIADLDRAASVARVHAAEALTYRFRPAMAGRMGASGMPGIVA